MLDRKIPFPAFALLFMVAGATDALIYLHSRDLLAVYMTGNSSHIGRHIGEGDWAGIAPLAAIIAAFLAPPHWAHGSGCGSGAGDPRSSWYWPPCP